jgi:ABC-type Mn2+/Zn2+ transport system permease subunit
VIDAIRDTWTFVREFSAEGFAAMIALSLAGPWLGAHLVARRAALSAFAAPWFSALGVALLAFATPVLGLEFEAGEGPEAWMRQASAALAVFGGLAGLAFAARLGFPVATSALLAIVVSGALRELLYLESPFPDLGAAGSGQILLLDVSGRNRVLGASALLVFVLALFGSRLLALALDPDRHRAEGGSPRAGDLLRLAFLGVYAAVAVPEIGLQAALALLILPPALLLRCAPSWRAALALGALAGPLGVCVGFHWCLSRDWPPGPAIVLGIALVAGLLALGARPFRR